MQYIMRFSFGGKKLAVLLSVFLLFVSVSVVKADKPSDMGFSDDGYNDNARIFNGTGSQWCIAGGQPETCLGVYSTDKLIMKWNAEWDRGNDEDWSNGPYKAWTSNEWNGSVPGGSGAVWHYKIVWVGDYTTNPSLIPDGAYGVWGQFATIMDQGTDPSYGPDHLWFAHANPTGYGAY